MNRHRGIHSAALALLPLVALAGAVQASPTASDQAAPAATASPGGTPTWHRHGPPMGELGPRAA